MKSNCAVRNSAITNRNTTMDTKALRQKILDLAIHGKLVPQDPNDEPASVLLERIKVEKERLIKEGKIRRSKKSAKTSDTPHYGNVLPDGWCFSTLGEVFTLQAGKNITAKDIKDTATALHPYKCYGGNGVRGFVALYNREGNFPIIGRQGALCGNINIAKEKFYATEHAVVVERYCDVDLMWAYYMLTALNLNQYATATAQPGLSVTVINDVCISLPPRKEQERISKEIGHWFALLDQIEQGKADLQTTIKLTKSKILDLAIHGKLVPQDPNDEPAIELLKRMNPDFTPCDNGYYPVGWIETILGELFSHNTGKALNSSNIEGIFKDYLTTSNVYWNKFDFTVIKQMPFKESELDKCTVTKGDLLVCEGGDIGRSAIWNYDYDICIQNHIHRLRPKINLCVPFYYYTFAYLKENNLIGGKGIGLLGLSSNALHKIEMPLPPLAEQQRIVQKIEELFSVLDNIQNALEV
jgi:type I restriction enzyme S subunit